MNVQQTEKIDVRRKTSELRPDCRSLEILSPLVLKNLQTLEIFKTAQTVGSYMPLPDEVDVAPLFSLPKKTFYVPAFDESIGSYRMAKYTPELRKGKFGIPEPANPVWAGRNELDLILVPGVAFDRAGNRLGRGGGFYDRLLPLYNAIRIGICFDFQLLEEIPAEPHDCATEWLVTENNSLQFEMNS